MSEHEDFYLPMPIDEQVDALLQGRIPSPRDQRMIADLRAILEHEDEDENARTLQKVQQKLFAKTGMQPTQKIIPITDRHLQGGLLLTRHHRSSQRPHRVRPLLRALEAVAAVLLLAALIGSLAMILNIAHQSHAGTFTPVAGSTTATPALSEGQILYQSPPLSLSVPVVWSPDGTRVATFVNHTGVESWDALTGKHVLKYPLGNAAFFFSDTNVVAWSPDGSKLAVAASPDVLIFNAQTAQLIRSLSPSQSSSVASGLASGSLSPRSDIGGGFEVVDVNWSSNGQKVSAFTSSGIVIWDVQSGALIRQLSGVYLFNSTVSVRELWQPHGQHLAAIGCEDPACLATQVSLWDTPTWSLVKQYPGVYTFDWSPDGTQLALVNMARTQVLLVNALTGQQVKQISAPRNQKFFDVQWSPDGSRLALGTVTNSSNLITYLSIGSITSGKQLFVFSRPNCELVRWASNSRSLSCIQFEQNGSGNEIERILIWAA